MSARRKPAEVGVVERGIPMPRDGRVKWPWLKMNVGESFLMGPAGGGTSSQVTLANQRYAPKRFEGHRTPDGYRVWRVA